MARDRVDRVDRVDSGNNDCTSTHLLRERKRGGGTKDLCPEHAR